MLSQKFVYGQCLRPFVTYLKRVGYKQKNRQTIRCRVRGLLLALGCGLALAGCASQPGREVPPSVEPLPQPIRFLLTFDDGPSAAMYLNPTQSVLDDLADNPLQAGVKALFFVQTRAGGASAIGRQLMQRQQAEGHLLGFHTATSGHFNHRYLDPGEFAQSLRDGIADIMAVAGSTPKLVRPPFWNYDQRTFATYQSHGLRVLLTDLSANDGEIWFINFSLRKRSNLRQQLTNVRAQLRAGALPAVDGAVPIVVTFHDINSYTARHLREYMQILVEVARELGLPTAAKPFYDERAGLERAALARTVGDAAQVAQLPGWWNWWWN